MLNREAILAAPDLKRETVNVPEWGGDVAVAELSADALTAFLAVAFDDTGKPALRGAKFDAALVAATLVDTLGVPLFGADEVESLAKKSPRALARVAAVANRLNFLTVETQETVAKN